MVNFEFCRVFGAIFLSRVYGEKTVFNNVFFLIRTKSTGFISSFIGVRPSPSMNMKTNLLHGCYRNSSAFMKLGS